MIIILMNKLMQVEALNSKVRIVLQDDSVIEGVSWGIIPAEDDEGEDLEYDEMFFCNGYIGITIYFSER